MVPHCLTSSFTAFSLLLLLLSTSATEEQCVRGVTVPPGNYSSWPTLTRLSDPDPTDPTAPNTADGPPVDPSVLLTAGVSYRYLDPAGYTYPNRTKEIPWSPPSNGTNDAALAAFRAEKDYRYADIVVVTGFLDKFFEEHLHAGGDEVRYVIDGSGYFDIRDVNDEWVRVHARAGDFVEFPSGIQHRFTVDENLYVQAMRLFPGSGEPDWSSIPRSEVHGNDTSRNAYVEEYLCGVDPDLDHEHEEGEDRDEGSHDGHNHSEDRDEGEHDDHDGHDHSDSAAPVSFLSWSLVFAAAAVGTVMF